jgi:hypothetical protein
MPVSLSLRLDVHRRAADVGRDRQLADVEAELVEPTDSRVDPPPLAAFERLWLRELQP